MIKDSKAQGPIEYLLLTGGAVLVAIVVVVSVISISSTGEESATDAINAWLQVMTGGNPPTPVTVTATIQDALQCNAVGSGVASFFYTSTDYGIVENDFGGVLYFTVSPNIPSTATITQATLTLYNYDNVGDADCDNVDPFYFYIDTALACQTVYNMNNDPPPAGWDDSDSPTPNDCLIPVSRSFEIPGAIDRDTSDLYIEIRANDVDGADYMRRWNLWQLGQPVPQLEIVYTP